jgi:ABC-2 type transport system ATP-binding protein
LNYCIETENLEKKYPNGYKALDNISFKIKKGDIVGYLGPNGAGKTTTIKILTNLIKPTNGHAYVNGIDVNQFPKQALKHIGALIEVPGIYDYFTPHELLTYFGKIHGMKRDKIEIQIKEILKELKLQKWENKKIGGFSTGMQRRLAIAKAIFHEPEIVILDEPVLGLDPKGIKDIRELIKQFQFDGMTIFLSSHLLQEVSETCNTVIFLDKGKIITLDSVENIKRKTEFKTIDVTFLSKISNKNLRKIELIEDIEFIENINDHFRLHFNGKPYTSYKILSRLFKCGFKVVSYSLQSKCLEDFYVSIIGDERRLT